MKELSTFRAYLSRSLQIKVKAEACMFAGRFQCSAAITMLFRGSKGGGVLGNLRQP